MYLHHLDSPYNLVGISKSGISSMFPSSIGSCKRAHTIDYCIFLGPGQPYISARATSKPNLSKSPLFNFLTSWNKVKDLLVPCIIFLAAASKCIVKNSQWTTCIKYRFSNKDYMNRFKTRFQTTLQFDVTVFPYFSSFLF